MRIPARHGLSGDMSRCLAQARLGGDWAGGWRGDLRRTLRRLGRLRLGPDHFVVVGDEHNVLTVYQAGQPRAVKTFTLGGFLGTDDDGESDLEGRRRCRPARLRHLVARRAMPRARSRGAGTGSSRWNSIRAGCRRGWMGRPSRDLLKDLAASPALASLPLKTAAERHRKARGGLNIEGLAAADGGLLIGFRNPLVDGKAILVPLENPDGLIDGKPAKIWQPATARSGRTGHPQHRARGAGVCDRRRAGG